MQAETSPYGHDLIAPGVPKSSRPFAKRVRRRADRPKSRIVSSTLANSRIMARSTQSSQPSDAQAET